MEGNQTRFVKSSDSDIKKLFPIIPFWKVQKSQKNYSVNVFEDEESYE